MPVPTSTSPMTIFAPLQAQPTLGFGGTGYVSWSGRTSSDAPYIPGTDTDAYDTWSLFCGDICIPDDAGVISVPLGAIYPRFAPGLGGYSTFPLHPMLSNGIDLASGVNTPLYDYDVTCDYQILPYADPDPSGVSAISGTDFDASSGTLTFQYPKCGYQDGYVDGPFEAGTRIATLSINVHGIGKFYPQFGPTANKNRFKVRFTNPIAMNLPGFTNDAIATSYELTFRILGTTAPPVYWQDYGTIDCGHVRGHIGFAQSFAYAYAGQTDLNGWFTGMMGYAGFSSAYNEFPARFTLPFTDRVLLFHPDGTNLETIRDNLQHPDVELFPNNYKRYLATNFEADLSSGLVSRMQDYAFDAYYDSGTELWYSTNTYGPLALPIVPLTAKVYAPPSYDTYVTYQGLYTDIPDVSFTAKNGPHFQEEIVPLTSGTNLIFWTGTVQSSGTGLTGNVKSMLVAYHHSLDFVADGGSGYELGDVVELSDGTNEYPCEITVTSVNGSGVVLDAQISEPGAYSVLPTGDFTTGGSGSGLQVNIHFGVRELEITSLGTGYAYGANIIFDSGVVVPGASNPSATGPDEAIAFFNTPGTITRESSINVSRYSSLLHSDVSSENTPWGYPLTIAPGRNTLDVQNLHLDYFYTTGYVMSAHPSPQNSMHTLAISASGLELWIGNSINPFFQALEGNVFGPVRGTKTNEYTVTDFLTDFAILSGLATPVMGRHKAVAFDCGDVEFVPQTEGATPSLVYNQDGRNDIEVVCSGVMLDGGSSYTSVPDVANDSDYPLLISSELTEVGVDSITLDTPGDGFTVTPTIRIEGGGGSGAAAHCDLVPTSVASITLTHRGTGYTSIPSVVVAGNATAVAVLTATAVDDVTINDAGRGYTAIPTVSFSPSGATATAYLKMVPQLAPNPAVIIASAGSGYTVGDLLYIGSGSPDLVTPAVIQVDTVDGSGGIMTASIHTAGVWSIDPGANPITSNGGGTGSGASFNVKWGVSHVVGPNYGDYTDIVGEFGGSYQDIPTVSFVGACDSAASATAVLKCTSLQSITLTDGGSGYTSRPTVTISGGGGVQAQAVAVLTGTPIDSITLDSSGSGYSSAPTVYFDYYGIVTEPTATAVLQNRSVESLTIDGITGQETVDLHFSGGGGTGASGVLVFNTANIDETDTSPMESGVARWQWTPPPSGVAVVFEVLDDVWFGRDTSPPVPDPPDYTAGDTLSPFRNPNEGADTDSELNYTTETRVIAASYYGIVGWYNGISQSEIDERITYRWQRRGVVGSKHTYIGQEYPVKVYATIITYAWRDGIAFSNGLDSPFDTGREISRRTVDITETDSYIVEPPGPGPDGEGGFCLVQFEYVVQSQATAPGPTSYP